MRRSHKVTALATALILMLACVPTLGPAPAPIPTFDPNAPLTAIVETANAAATQTAVNSSPTPTPTVPTKTPFPTPTATATFIFIPPTSAFQIQPTLIPLGNSNKEYDCQVVDAEPKRALAPNEGFTAKWIVANIGKSTWDENNLDYSYKEGEKVHFQPAYDFPATIQPGLTVELKVEMLAPSVPGNYVTVWQIKRGKSGFCEMTLNFTVQ